MTVLTDSIRIQMADWLSEIDKRSRKNVVPINNISEIPDGYEFTYYGNPDVRMICLCEESLLAIVTPDGDARLDTRPVRPPQYDPKLLAAQIAKSAHDVAITWNAAPIVIQLSYLTQAVLLAADLLDSLPGDSNR